MQGKGEPLPLQPIPKTKNNNKTKTNNKIKVVYTEDWTHPVRRILPSYPLLSEHSEEDKAGKVSTATAHSQTTIIPLCRIHFQQPS